jgi:hypothetical protein
MEKRWTLALMPLSLLVPAFTAVHWLNEIHTCRRWPEVLEDREKSQRMFWDMDSSLEANWG